MTTFGGGDLESGQELGLEESALKELKKQLKETFTKINDAKEQFDTSKENL